jgi:hypothetical protein
VPLERYIPSLVVEIKAEIAVDSWGSKTVADAAERTAGAVLGYSDAEGSRRVPRYKENVKIVL